MPTKNRLSREKSPYLLQHASNPVAWFPWGMEALETAKKEGKPLFISIGYSTCHWCHVMAEESFSSKEVAELLNKYFISIKVDREELPHIDAFYMEYCVAVNGTGGWPLNIFATPEGEPFYAFTYLPRAEFVELIKRVAELWREHKQEIEVMAKRGVASLSVQPTIEGAPGEEIVIKAFGMLENSYDPQTGGFGTAPKFPLFQNILFLLRYWRAYSEEKALEMAVKTLLAIRMGGIFDQIGFGIHRYSTDRFWRLPHFEKMLYDQALALWAYSEAFQATSAEIFKRTAEQIFEYMLRELYSEQGAFYSAQDADVDGEEGKFYIWSMDEIESILNRNELEAFKRSFGIHRGVIYAKKLDSEAEEIRRQLFEYRERRKKPMTDTKILADWNSLTAITLCRAHRLLGSEEYLKAAERAVDFVTGKMLRDVLYHSYFSGEVRIPGLLEDYSFLLLALLELHQSTLKQEYLDRALMVADLLLQKFWNGRAFFRGEQGFQGRRVYLEEGAVPGGNSTAFLSFIILYGITSRREYLKVAQRLARVLSNSPGRVYFLSFLLDAASFRKVNIYGREEEVLRLLKKLWSLLPSHVVYTCKSASGLEAEVCTLNSCLGRMPVKKLSEALSQISMSFELFQK